VAIDRKSIFTLLVLGVAGYIGYQYYIQSQSDDESDSETDPTDSATTGNVTNTLQTLWENVLVTTGVTDWQDVGEGPTYVPYLNQTEQQYGIPTNLLARIAYQESHFRADIISGATVSPAGAVGIMQLEPQYFPGAGQNPMTDIGTAGAYLAKLYTEFGDWQVATAAYNDGPGNLAKYEAGTLTTLPLETQNYVADIFADVPVQGSLIQVS
jgi:soluble lytic murein transglycosylase-like protein